MTSRNTAFWSTVVSAVIDDLRDMCNVAAFDVQEFVLDFALSAFRHLQ
jgi:hypothetical protein